MLDCVNIEKRYGGKFAVNGVSVRIEDAHIYGLLGPNGSGKSTWMKMAAGLIVPDDGQMTLDGVKIGAETKRHIAYMPTEGYFYSYMKIKDVGRYYQDFFDEDVYKRQGKEGSLSLIHRLAEYEAIQKLSSTKHYPIDRLCKYLNVTRSAYYRWVKYPKSNNELRNERLSTEIQRIHNQHPDCLLYTLDVYKRQLLYCCVNQIQIIFS